MLLESSQKHFNHGNVLALALKLLYSTKGVIDWSYAYEQEPHHLMQDFTGKTDYYHH